MISFLSKFTIIMLLKGHLSLAQNLPSVSPPESFNTPQSNMELYFSTLSKEERELALIRLTREPGLSEDLNILLSVGTNPNAYNASSDIYALGQAATHSNYDAVNLLLKAGANTEFTNSNKTTALMIAAEHEPLRRNYKEKDIINFLLQNGAKANATDAHGNTVPMYLLRGIMSRQVLHLSANDRPHVDRLNESFVFFLPKVITAGADLNASNHLGETALHQCVPPADKIRQDCCPLQIVLSLIEAGVDINKKTKEGKTAEDLAEEAKRRQSGAFSMKCATMSIALNTISKGGTIAEVLARFQAVQYTSIHTGNSPRINTDTEVNSSDRNSQEKSSDSVPKEQDKTGVQKSSANR